MIPDLANLIVFFCLLPLCTALLSVTVVNNRWASRIVGLLGLTTTFTTAVVCLTQLAPTGHIAVTQLGGWSAPYGITLVMDSFSALLIAAASAVALGAYVHSFSTLDPRVERRYFHPLIHMLIFGVNLSFLTGDLFNLFVAFEIMLMSSYALLCLGASDQQLRHAYKYVLLNILASTIFLMTAGMTYGMLGTLNLADMARIVAENQAAGKDMPAGFTALGVMFLFVFGLKGAFFPLWFWLPDTYWTLPIAISGLFGGLLTKVGVYAIARTFPLIFAQAPPTGIEPSDMRVLIMTLIAASAAFTMFLAVLGAVSQHHVRRILSIHVISQVGYMVFGIAVMTGQALAGCAFYMVQHMVVKCSLFLCCGLMEKHAGTDDLDKLGSLLKRDLGLGVLFFVAAMSLVGLPPLSGFFGKMVIIQSGWDQGLWWLAILGLLTGALTLLSMLKIWSYGFWNPGPAPTAEPAETVRSGNRAAYIGTGMLVGLALFLGFCAPVVYEAAFTAGRQLYNPTDYVQAVLGEQQLENIKWRDTITAPVDPPQTDPSLALRSEP
ncbi:proton-conducting transporter transmembrane domain-containing protein [Mucisphaera calidilacus]|uniref:Na(+)/H(+) antiporter subunit D n=1 Tax=Mucisphaera calidilacus TaxID=2527982 RepID=A0A518BX74_9BACT|nr:proton-conducting transporter membrane subunit [Mucisphaera calidilacus]QDU71571.1 Na(+)/H(+) antiporter subunit D [Mucisphaera calidilacus]